MRIGDVVQLNVDDINNNFEYTKIKHMRYSYLYRLDIFLTEYKKNLRFKSNRSKNIESQQKKILKMDKKLFELQFYIPFIHLNMDVETLIENKEFKLNKNVNIMILEDLINSAEISILELAHNKLTEYQKLLLQDKRRVSIRKNPILSNINILTDKDHLAYSYLYKLNYTLMNHNIYNNNNNDTCDFTKLPEIPGLIFKKTINNKIHRIRSNDKKENTEIIIDIDDILKASEEELKLAHKILFEYLKNY